MSKFVVKAHVDSIFSYTGLFSSVEEALKILPKCPGFRRALYYNMPESMTNLVPDELRIVRVTSPIRINNWETYSVYGTVEVVEHIYEDIPEHKVPGEPYKPAERKLVDTVYKSEEVMLGVIEFTWIPIDTVQE